jgi:hypothetical protein
MKKFRDVNNVVNNNNRGKNNDNKKLFLCLSTTTLRHKRKWMYSSTHLNIDTRWKWMVGFVLLTVLPLGKDGSGDSTHATLTSVILI